MNIFHLYLCKRQTVLKDLTKRHRFYSWHRVLCPVFHRIGRFSPEESNEMRILYKESSRECGEWAGVMLFWSFFFLLVLEIEPRTLHILDKSSTIELHTNFILVFYSSLLYPTTLAPILQQCRATFTTVIIPCTSLISCFCSAVPSSWNVPPYIFAFSLWKFLSFSKALLKHSLKHVTISYQGSP